MAVIQTLSKHKIIAKARGEVVEIYQDPMRDPGSFERSAVGGSISFIYEIEKPHQQALPHR